MGWDHLTAADGFAFAMLAVIAASFGVLLALFLSMRRQARRRDSQVDELLQELEAAEKKTQADKENPEPPPSPPPWERPPDWWKDPK
ncbi:hypothetical protein KBB96_05340 [Luteolibacter ambystomatis]|uniref:Uncharacterized protein n=1 Tax=Luteolibacter ambystomatis TaxID=2824561 RepID=A0A975PGJ7_9BACT|nr:hypothetical protein [Luteolibacter ambystomatis]QUE52316.1 hypothetical protein KBB96_05340 [Luteolibacter ambystomatis]